MQHIHVSALDALIVMSYVLIGLFLLRMLAIKLRDTPAGKALATIVA